MIIKHRGCKPVLVLSIHSCASESPTNPKRRKEAKLSRELNEALYPDLGYHSLIYTGFRTRCIRDTKAEIADTIEGMLSIYGKIGVMSLHGRGKRYTVKQYPDSLFELGTLKGKTLDKQISVDLAYALKEEGIIFDHDHKMTGGAEIRFMHKMFNDPLYERGKKSDNDPRMNRVQIAQLEFDDWKDDWLKEGIDQRIQICKALGDIMIAYLGK